MTTVTTSCDNSVQQIWEVLTQWSVKIFWWFKISDHDVAILVGRQSDLGVSIPLLLAADVRVCFVVRLSYLVRLLCDTNVK